MSSSHPTVLETVPADRTPDTGSVHRGGPLTWFIACVFGFATIGSALVLTQEHRTAPALLCFAVFGAISLYATGCLIEHLRHRTPLPRSHSVLSSVLGFEIHCTTHDVASTVFFLPDETKPGDPTHLLCFVENYASRHRIADFRIGPHRHLGLTESKTVSLKLAPGQTAVYRLPLVVSPGITPGEHDLPVVLRVRMPGGSGVLLPGARRHLYDIWTSRFAAPFTVSENPSPAATPATPGTPEFLSLASVSDPAPRLESLAESRALSA